MEQEEKKQTEYHTVSRLCQLICVCPPCATLRTPPPLSFPTPGKTTPHYPLGDGCQVTVPHPPPGGPHHHRTRTFKKRRTDARSCKTVLPSQSKVMRRFASPCSECPTTCAKTGSAMERMKITFVPGGNMVVRSSSISAKVSKTSCHECKGYKWQCPTTQSPTQQHNEPQRKILG